MHVLRDAASIRAAVTGVDPLLSPVLAERVAEWSDYPEFDLNELVWVVILDPCDGFTDLQSTLPAIDQPPDAFDVHPGWFELVYVLSDDGFGAVLFIPRVDGLDPAVVDLCCRHSATDPHP